MKKVVKKVVAKKPMMKKAQSGVSTKKKGAMDAVKDVAKYVSTFGGATERDNPKQKDTNIVKKLKETGSMVKSKLGMKKGGAVKKAKKGGSFPDLNKDGKITKADILKGRGVIAKKGKAVKKAEMGGLLGKMAAKKGMMGAAGRAMGGLMGMMGRKKQSTPEAQTTMKKGGKMKKCKYGCK